MKQKNYCETCRFFNAHCAGIHGNCEVDPYDRRNFKAFYIHPHHTCERYECRGVNKFDAVVCHSKEEKYDFLEVGKEYRVESIWLNRKENEIYFYVFVKRGTRKLTEAVPMRLFIRLDAAHE